MRIRQQAKLTGVPISNGISSGDQIKLHCHLSQSPWDVISFPPPVSSSPQIGGDHGFTPGGSSGNSLAAVESVDSMKIYGSSGRDTDLLLLANGDDDNGDNYASLCGMTDGKSWKCMNEVAEGQAVCQYHLHQRSVATSATVVTDRPRKKRATQRVAPPPEEPVYYFYTEFGPWWTKQRGGAKGKNRTKHVAMEVDGGEKQKQYGYVNDYDSDGEGIGEVGRVKRARKPIKARSLKSLM